MLAAHFGDKTTLRSFTACADALRPAGVAMYQLDRFDKKVLSAEVDAGELDTLGEIDARGLLPGSLESGRVVVARNAASGTPEMEALCRGLFHESDWFVDAEGEIDAAAYEHVLKPRATVNVKGVGETWSGTYYVSYVRHTFTEDGYSQHFRARRNALEPGGAEDF